MKAVKGVRKSFVALLAVVDRNVVPIAAGVLGWMFGGRFALWVLDSIVPDAGFRLALVDSLLFVYGMQSVVAVVLFFIALRYLQ
jgi:hypothetical protein